MRELSLNVLDIAQNSVVANSSLVTIEALESSEKKELTLRVSDNGRGMTKEQLESVRDPFFTTRTTRRIGLGVPLFKMAAEMTGGSFSIESKVGEGTVTTAVFKTDNVDFTPLGDMTGTVVTLITMNTNMDFVYRFQKDEKLFELDTRQLREVLGDVPFSEPSIAQWLTEYIRENTSF